MAIRYPDHLQAEKDKIYADYFAQFGEDDIIDEADLKAYYEAHASEEQKQCDRELQEYIDSLPPGVHV